ncbi:hypothetical protein ES708_17922 [subsurface metagenome]
MKVARFPVGPLETNCYMVTCEKTNYSVVVDPGGISQSLLDAIDNTHISAVLLTHGHFDHISGVEKVVEITGAPIKIHPLDAHMLKEPHANGSAMIGANIIAPEATDFLADGDKVQFGKSLLTVAYTPGHSQGGVSFIAENDFVLAGDTLFRMSVGRWDLPGGNYKTLIDSLRTVFYNLPDNVAVYAGHGESSTIGFEKTHNQFLAG